LCGVPLSEALRVSRERHRDNTCVAHSHLPCNPFLDTTFCMEKIAA